MLCLRDLLFPIIIYYYTSLLQVHREMLPITEEVLERYAMKDRTSIPTAKFNESLLTRVIIVERNFTYIR